MRYLNLLYLTLCQPACVGRYHAPATACSACAGPLCSNALHLFARAFAVPARVLSRVCFLCTWSFPQLQLRPLGGIPPLNHGRAASTLTIGARHCLLWLTSFSLLASVCTAETPHLAHHPHNTPAYNYTPPHTHTLHTACQRTWLNCFEIFLSEKLPHGLTAAWYFGVWIPNPDALPIIASVFVAPIICLFACFYESVSCVYVFFSTCRSSCVVRAVCFVFCSIFITSFELVINMKLLTCLSSFSICMSIILILAYVYMYSNSCACVYKEKYAFPWSLILVRIHRHFHMYSLCDVLYLYPCFLCAFFFVRNLIDTCVTVSIDVFKFFFIS